MGRWMGVSYDREKSPGAPDAKISPPKPLPNFSICPNDFSLSLFPKHWAPTHWPEEPFLFGPKIATVLFRPFRALYGGRLWPRASFHYTLGWNLSPLRGFFNSPTVPCFLGWNFKMGRESGCTHKPDANLATTWIVPHYTSAITPCGLRIYDWTEYSKPSEYWKAQEQDTKDLRECWLSAHK